MTDIDFSRRPRIEVLNQDGKVAYVSYPFNATQLPPLQAMAESHGTELSVKYQKKRVYQTTPSFKSRYGNHILFKPRKYVNERRTP